MVEHLVYTEEAEVRFLHGPFLIFGKFYKRFFLMKIMGIFRTAKRAGKPEIRDKHVRTLVNDLRRDLSPFYEGILTVEVYHPEKKEHGPNDPATIALVNRIPAGILGLNPVFNYVFQVNDGPTGSNYVAARYKDEVVREIIKRRLKDYKMESGIEFVLEHYSE